MYGAIVFAVAFAVTYAMVPVSKRIARLLGAIDYPSNRRVNRDPVPRCGGIALYVGITAGAFALFIGKHFFGWSIVDLYPIRGVNFSLLYIGVSFMFGVGLVDDITQIRPLYKFIGQVIAAIIVYASGISIGTVQAPIEGGYLNLEWMDGPITVLYLVIFVNITNLIDGLDGLASGIVIIVSAALMYMVWVRGSYTLAIACVAVMGTCLAFLRFNFFPASIFMGDSGSLLLGLVVGILSIEGVVRTQSFIIMLVPLAIAGVPVLDTASAVIRRLRGHKHVSEADMDHLHHRLMRAGLGQKRSVGVLWLCTAMLAVAGCAISDQSNLVGFVMFCVLAVIIVFVIWKFGLFSPVLKHHYDNRGQVGPRLPRNIGGKGKTS